MRSRRRAERDRLILAALAAAVLSGGMACGSAQSQTPPAVAPTGDSSRIGDFVWQDLMTDEVAKSRTFYEQLFGWKFEETSRLGRPYFIARSGSSPVAGMASVARRAPDEPVAQWLSYLAVNDVDAVASRVTAAGGRLLVTPTAINTNRAAVAVDPQGAPIGLVTLGTTVILPVGGPTAPVGAFFWRDYLARDVETARTFYSDLAGLTADRPNREGLVSQYILRRPGPLPVAGIIAIGARDITPNWLPYIRVTDPVAMATRAEQLGGRILMRASPDIRNGSVAVVTDPAGAAMALQKWPI
jgi:predicted enzyme related to lactoylglutathione lyase